MFNGSLKRNALVRLERVNEAYEHQAQVVAQKSTLLYQCRKNSTSLIIKKAEYFVNRLAHTPKSFDRSVHELKISFERFNAIVRDIERSDNVATVSGSVAGAGITAGAGVAAFGPTAAMAIATTFGTASTGTAISALTGAAASNAALAWLGGGALAAGGGGMVAGKTILALAGPVGWAIGGLTLMGAGVWARHKNRVIAEEATRVAIEAEKACAVLRSVEHEIDELYRLTRRYTDGAMRQLNYLQQYAPVSYLAFSNALKSEMAALINNIYALSELMKRNVGKT